MDLDFDDLSELDIPISDAHLSHLSSPSPALDRVGRSGASATASGMGMGDGKKSAGGATSSGMNKQAGTGEDMGLMDWQDVSMEDDMDFEFSSTFPSSTPVIPNQSLSPSTPRLELSKIDTSRSHSHELDQEISRPSVNDGLDTPLTARPIGSRDHSFANFQTPHTPRADFNPGSTGMEYGLHSFGGQMPSHPTHGSDGFPLNSFGMGMNGGLSMSMINPPKLPLPVYPGATQIQINQQLHQQQLQQQQQTIAASALWPGSASLPNLAGLGLGISPPSVQSLGLPGGKRPKKRARTDKGDSDEEDTQDMQSGKKDTGAGDDSDADSELGEVDGDRDGLGMMGMSMSMDRTGGLVDPATMGVFSSSTVEVKTEQDGQDKTAGSSSSSSAKSGPSSSGKPNGSTPAGGNKKKKVPPPGGFKPWNTSPSSSHLPSGSACINPVTGEVELPPMDNLTKEEIRKVKNRASAQRSRTRKGELLGGLMDEVNRLRERLRDVTNGAEGGDGDDASMGAEEFLRKTHAARSARGGSVVSSNDGGSCSGTTNANVGNGSSSGGAKDEEKEGMKMLIERLRAEVENEKKVRQAAELEAWTWRQKHEQLINSIALGANGNTIHPGLVSSDPSVHSPGVSLVGSDKETLADSLRAMDDIEEDELVEFSAATPNMASPPLEHIDAASLTQDEQRKELIQAVTRKRERAVVKGSQRDSKGVLMMVVLFSFALFSIPPHLRTPGFNTSTAFHMSANSNAETAALFDKLLPYDATKSSSDDMDTDDQDKHEALLAIADAAAKGIEDGQRRQPMKGKKSLSFTLLRPIDEERAAEFESAGSEPSSADHTASGNVEDVLEKWLGLSLFDNGSTTPSEDKPALDRNVPGGWVVVKSSISEDDDTPLVDDKRFAKASSSRSSTASPTTQGYKSLTAWDGTPIESMQLDEDVLSVSHHRADLLSRNGLTMPFAPDKRVQPDGPSPTLAPEFQEDPLADEQRAQRAASVPTSIEDSATKTRSSTGISSRRQSLSVLGNGHTPSRTVGGNETPSRIRSMPSSALMALDESVNERYMKLELEVDFEVELTCKGVRRKRADRQHGEDAEDQGRTDGISLVGKEEVGRLLSSGLTLGKEGSFLSLGT